MMTTAPTGASFGGVRIGPHQFSKAHFCRGIKALRSCARLASGIMQSHGSGSQYFSRQQDYTDVRGIDASAGLPELQRLSVGLACPHHYRRNCGAYPRRCTRCDQCHEWYPIADDVLEFVRPDLLYRDNVITFQQRFASELTGSVVSPTRLLP
jgi:hypothetical protein